MNQHYDAVVVGGGAGGTYAAWQMQTGDVSAASRLAQDPAQRSIALFELSDRIGGRLESIVPPAMQTLYAEFGGMGFTSNDTILNALVQQLGLASEPFPRGGANNILYLRGVHFTNANATNPSIVPYRLAATEQGIDPRALVPTIIENVFPGCSTWTAEQWATATSQPYNGRSLSDMGFWNFLLENMSNEALSYARDAMGHFFEVANWNCAQALPWYMLDGTATYSTLTEGYDLLPKTMADEFTSAGGDLFMSTTVASVQQYTTGPQGQTTMEITTADGRTCTADVVVLALPRRSLELITSDVLAESGVQQLVGSVTGQPVMKVFLCFEQMWWKSLGIAQGSSGTDLPVGQVWYFGPDPDTNNSLLLGTYDDTLATSFWEGLSSGPSFPTTNGNPSSDWAAQAPSADMVAELQRQLGEMHQMTVPEPYSAAWMDWSQDPYGGAFNTWNVGVDAAAVAQAILQPDPSVPLYVCGEAYSLVDQGWVEGALETAQSVLEMLGAETPAWLGNPVSASAG
jgi:monoamine oxidase